MTPPDPIAIVGIAARFPGAADVDGFWDAILAGRESIRDLGDEELLGAGVDPAWLADPETNTYGGAYIWQNREAMKAYADTEVFKGMATNPHFEGVTVKDFAVLENPTRITVGLAGVA